MLILVGLPWPCTMSIISVYTAAGGISGALWHIALQPLPGATAWLRMQVYYHNPSTGESSWQKPEGFEGDAGSAGAAPVPISSEQIPNTGWSEVTCSDGRRYYYHAAKEVRAFQPSKQFTSDDITSPQISLAVHIHLHATELQTSIHYQYTSICIVVCVRRTDPQLFLSA